MCEALSSAHNIGPAMEVYFENTEIKDTKTLRDLGADEGYQRFLSFDARRHFIAYFVVFMGLQGRLRYVP